MSVILKSDGVVLPTPSEITPVSELIWSSDTGRTLSGEMTGSIKAEKKTFEMSWNVLTKAEISLILSKLPRIGKGFVTIEIDGHAPFKAYRGSFKYGSYWFNGTEYKYKGSSVTLIEV